MNLFSSSFPHPLTLLLSTSQVLLPSGLPPAPPAPSTTPGVLIPTPPASIPSGTLEVVFTVNIQATSTTVAAGMATALQTDATLAGASRTGLFKAAIASTGSNSTAPFLGLILLSVSGVAPNPSVNAEFAAFSPARRLEAAALARRLQSNAVPVKAALLIASTGGAANSALAASVSTSVNAQVLNANSVILSANLAPALSQLSAAGFPSNGAAGVPGSASVVDPTPPAPGSSNNNAGPIVGGVIGGIAILGALVGLGFYWRKRQASSAAEYSSLKANALDSNPYAAQRSYS